MLTIHLRMRISWYYFYIAIIIQRICHIFFNCVFLFNINNWLLNLNNFTTIAFVVERINWGYKDHFFIRFIYILTLSHIWIELFYAFCKDLLLLLLLLLLILCFRRLEIDDTFLTFSQIILIYVVITMFFTRKLII